MQRSIVFCYRENVLYMYFEGHIVYDDGCHLKKFAQNPRRRDLTAVAKRLSTVSIVVDKMHMKGHVDRWCKENCDASKVDELNQVGSQTMRRRSVITIS